MGSFPVTHANESSFSVISADNKNYQAKASGSSGKKGLSASRFADGDDDGEDAGGDDNKSTTEQNSGEEPDHSSVAMSAVRNTP